MRGRGGLAGLGLALLLAAGPAGAGDVTGVVRYGGAAPPAPALPVTKDQGACGREVPDESVLVAGGRLANAVVSLAGAPGAPPARATLDQRGCRFVPHVQAVPRGSTLEILNGDPLLHSVHGWQGHATRFDVPTAEQGARVPVRLDRAGVIQVRCDVHAWMSAWLVVTEGPAAVTGADGSFTLRGVPPGRYTLTAWHERLGERSAQVTVPAEGEVRVELAFGG